MDTPAGEHSTANRKEVRQLTRRENRPALSVPRANCCARAGGGTEGSKPQPAGECYLNRKGRRPSTEYCINSVPAFAPPFAAR